MAKAKVAARKNLSNEERAKLGLPLLGKPPVRVAEGMEILSNGLYKHQWEWLKQYGTNAAQPIDGAVVQRIAVQWFIDATEASRAGVVATPEQDRDFEKLSLSNKKKRKQSVRK